jgi:hypothetical protein
MALPDRAFPVLPLKELVIENYQNPWKQRRATTDRNPNDTERPGAGPINELVRCYGLTAVDV